MVPCKIDDYCDRQLNRSTWNSSTAQYIHNNIHDKYVIIDYRQKFSDKLKHNWNSAVCVQSNLNSITMRTVFFFVAVFEVSKSGTQEHCLKKRVLNKNIIRLHSNLVNVRRSIRHFQ